MQQPLRLLATPDNINLIMVYSIYLHERLGCEYKYPQPSHWNGGRATNHKPLRKSTAFFLFHPVIHVFCC